VRTTWRDSRELPGGRRRKAFQSRRDGGWPATRPATIRRATSPQQFAPKGKLKTRLTKESLTDNQDEIWSTVFNTARKAFSVVVPIWTATDQRRTNKNNMGSS
jgi:hypothetical protein